MSIPTSYYTYDELGRYYYLTLVGAEALTGIDSLGEDMKNPEVYLKRQGLLLKQAMVMATNDTKRTRRSRKDFVEYAQFKFEDKRDAVIQMLSELAFWSWQSDADLIPYENPSEFFAKMPHTIRQIGSDSRMLYMGQTIYEVPEDEYQVGY